MKKQFLAWLVATGAVMLFLPWAVVTFARGDAGMALCFLLFFAVNPVYSVAVGVAAGKDKTMGLLPIVSAALFLLGVWAFFDMGERAFLGYAAAYLAIGLASMAISAAMHRKERNEDT